MQGVGVAGWILRFGVQRLSGVGFWGAKLYRDPVYCATLAEFQCKGISPRMKPETLNPSPNSNGGFQAPFGHEAL